MVLKAEVSFSVERTDKNILVFVKIFLDVFQGIAKSCQGPPLILLCLTPDTSIFG